MDRAAAFADALPLSFWLDDPAAPEPALPLVGATRADLVVVGGGYTGLWAALLAKQRRPVARRRGAGGRPVRLGRLGPQRRVLRGQPHPRAGQRGGAVPRRGRHPRAAGPREPRRHRGHRGGRGHRLRLRAHRRARRGHRAPPGRLAARGRGPGPSARRPSRCSSTATSCRPRSTRRPTWPGCGSPTAARWSTPPGWPGACGRRASGPGCASTSTPASRAWSPPDCPPVDPMVVRTDPRDGRPPPGWCWPPTPRPRR